MKTTSTTRETLQGFVKRHTMLGTRIYTDEHAGYNGLDNHKAIIHTWRQYVDGDAHTNGIESFWAMLKRSYSGTHHYMSPKHLDRYVNEFAGRHNGRRLAVDARLEDVWRRMRGKRLRYADLVA